MIWCDCHHEKIEKVLRPDLTLPIEGVNELFLDGKAHDPSSFLRRVDKSGKGSTSKEQGK